MKPDPTLRAHILAERGLDRQAFRVLLGAARAGDGGAYLNLGYAYDNGLGVRRSKRKAVRWYRRAFEQRDGAAAHNIATIYRDRGDVLRAMRWLHRAADLGESGSNVLLGQLLLARLGDVQAAIAAFRSVGSDACEADVEAAAIWAATAESMGEAAEQ